MPYTQSSAMNAGVPQIGGDEEMAFRQRQSRMSDYLARAQIEAELAMNRDNIADRRAGREYQGNLDRDLKGTYGERHAGDMEYQSGDYAGRSALLDREIAGRLAGATIEGSYGIDKARIAAGPQQTTADYLARQGDRAWEAGSPERDFNNGIYGAMNGAMRQQPGQAPVIDPGMMQRIIGAKFGVKEDPLDAMVREAIGKNIAGSDDPAAALTAYRTTGRAPTPMSRETPGEGDVEALAPIGLRSRADTFAKRDTSIFGFDPTSDDMTQIIMQRDALAQSIAQKHRLDPRRARQIANDYINKSMIAGQGDVNAGWIQALQQLLNEDQMGQ